MSRDKLSVKEQISHMENNGISFSLISKPDAETFLSSSNYYFKIKSFAKNYDKIGTSDGKSRYVNLDFAYLKELSVLDMHLRKIIFSMTSDIEHFLKVKLLNDCSNNIDEDGYSVVAGFLSKYPYVQKSIANKCSMSATSDLVIKYCSNWAVWNIVEVLSFGDFIKLYKYYYQKYPQKTKKYYAIDSLRFLRNAAAHNNCLLNSIKRPYLQIQCNKASCLHKNTVPIQMTKLNKTKELSTVIAKDQNKIGISKAIRQKRLSNPVIHDITALLYLYPQICSRESSEATRKMWLTFFQRCLKNQSFFGKNQQIVAVFQYVKKIFDFYFTLCDNLDEEQKDVSF